MADIRTLQAIETKLVDLVFPNQIVIETTSICNFFCSHCNHVNLKRPKKKMEIRLYQKIINEIAQHNPSAEVWPTFYGEALVHGFRIYYLLDYARKAGLTNVVLNSNGSFLSEEDIEMILHSGLKRFILSLDGFTKETFEAIRQTNYKNGKFDVVYPNVLRLLQRRQELSLEDKGVPDIVCQFSCMDENKHEVEAFKEYWKSKGAIVKIREKLTWTGTRDASNLGKNFSHRIACPWGINTCAIHQNGDVVACAVDHSAGFIAGNLNQLSLKEIWNGTHKAFRQNHLLHKWETLPVLCQKCPDWQAVGALHEGVDGKKFSSIATSY